MSIASLQARVNHLFDCLKQTQQLISRLPKLSSAPGYSPNNPDEGDPRVDLSNEIHQSLKEQEEDFELVRQETEDLISRSNPSRLKDTGRDNDREREKNDLKSQVSKFEADLKMYEMHSTF